jgi:hypothetical protein
VKLERLPEYVITTVATIIGIFLALYCGRLVGEGRTGTVFSLFLAGFAVILVLTLRSRIYLLILILAPFYGQVPSLALPFSVRHLSVMFVAAACAALIALKVMRRKAHYGFMDLLLVGNIAYLATAFVRNPVGTMATGSDRVGGRPYFDVAIAFVAYLILARCTMTPKEARRLPLLVLLGNVGQMFIEAITFFRPELAGVIGQFYSGVTLGAETSVQARAQEAPYRHGYFAGVTAVASALICAWFKPLTLINPLYFWRSLAFFSILLAIFFTGFRSALVGLAFYFGLSVFIRGGLLDVIRSCSVGIILLLVLVTMQGNVIDLPPSVQRALSFLPGKWDQNVVSDSSNSLDWRVQMWKEMLFTDRYIKSKILGDGFGFSVREYQIQQALEVSPVDLQDYYLITGSVHSGPISTIRYVGVIGLILYTWLMVIMCQLSFSLIRRARGTGFFEPVLFVTLPIIYAPFGYFIVFGAFEVALPHTILSVGMLKLFENALGDFLGHGGAAPVRDKITGGSLVAHPSRRLEPMITTRQPAT